MYVGFLPLMSEGQYLHIYECIYRNIFASISVKFITIKILIIHIFMYYFIYTGNCVLPDTEYSIPIFDFGESVNHSIAYPDKSDFTPVKKDTNTDGKPGKYVNISVLRIDII
jgi:hypothetical protein